MAMNTELISKLEKILETAIFYNAAVELYYEQFKLVDNIENIVSNCSVKNKKILITLISQYFSEKIIKNEQCYLDCIYLYSFSENLIKLMKKLKAEFNLTWDWYILNRKIRDELKINFLIEDYFHILSLINKMNKNEKLKGRIDRLSILLTIRNENLFFKDRVKSYINKESGVINIYYDKSKTSIRQSFIFSLNNYSNIDNLKFLKEKKFFTNLNSYCGTLLYLAYIEENRKKPLSKECFFEKIASKYFPIYSNGLSDIRIIYRGKKKLNKIQEEIKNLYELKESDLAIQKKRLSCKKHEVINEMVSAHLALNSALYSYVRYYIFILKNLTFFKEFKKFRELVFNEFIHCYETKRLNSHISLLLNHINCKNIYNDKLKSELIMIESKYMDELKSLREYNVNKSYWGYFFCSDIFLDIDDVIKFMGRVNKICHGNYNLISHENINQLNLAIVLQNATLINHIIPTKSKITHAGYGVSNHLEVIPMNNKDDILGNIDSALRLYDNNARSYYLNSTIDINKTNKIEEILWGIYHFYKMEFNDGRVTESISIEMINKFYEEPILESKFISGKKEAKKRILAIDEPYDN